MTTRAARKPGDDPGDRANGRANERSNAPASGPTSDDAALRLRYLQEVGAKLWPDPAAVVVGSGRGAGRGARPASDFLLVPGARKPRLLVPAGAPRASAAAIQRYTEPKSRYARARSRALAVALGSGLAGFLLRDRVRVYADEGTPTIETYLRQALREDLLVSLHVGPARANRKPVLQLLTPDGETVAFSKIGVNGLTTRLVRAEGDSLRRLAAAPLRLTSVPEVLHQGTWNALEVLVQSSLPVWSERGELPAGRLASAMREVAESQGVQVDRLAASPYWSTLRSALADSGDGEHARALREAADRVHARAPETPVRFGAWHGDWTPWNMAALPHAVLVWDWERFTTGVPMGFDALHYHLQSAVVHARRPPRAAVAECVRDAESILAPFAVEPGQARLTALLYLLEIATRYLRDGQAEAGARLGALGSWLLPILAAEVGRL